MSQAILNNAKLCNVAAVMVAPILDDVENLATLVDINRRRLREAARIAIQFAKFHSLDHYKPAAGLYVWIRFSSRCRTWSEEEEIVRRCSQNGVSIGSGADYAESYPGWFRVTFSVPQPELLAGLQRIEEAMGYSIRFRSTLEHRLMSSWRQWLKLPRMWIGPVKLYTDLE